MPDYNIYIHSVNDLGGTSSPTKAWKKQQDITQTDAWTPEYSGYPVNTDDLPTELKEMGTDALKKAFPVIAIAIAIYKIAMKAVETVEPFITRESGDYRFNTWLSNYKVGTSMIFNPASTALGAANYLQENRIFNKGQEQQRLLLGDSFINSNYRKV